MASTSKLGILKWVGIAAVALAFIGMNVSVPIIGYSLTFVVGALILAELFGVLGKIPLLNILSGRLDRQTAVMILVGLAIVTFAGISLSSLTGGAGLGALPALPSAPSAAAPAVAAPLTIGASVTGTLNLKPIDAEAAAWTDTTYKIYILDSSMWAGNEQATRYNLHKLVSEGKLTSLKAVGGFGQAVPHTVATNTFSEEVTAKQGDKAIIFGYLDATPAINEPVSIAKEIVISGYNPEQDLLQWSFIESGSRNLQIFNYSENIWSDPTSDATVSGYTDDEDTAASGKTFLVNMMPDVIGGVGLDQYLYLETTPAETSDLAVTIAGVEYTTLVKVSDLPSNSNIYRSAPPIANGGVYEMYTVGAIPDTKRTADSGTGLGKTSISLSYAHPGSGTPALIDLNIVENANALSINNGHFDSPTSAFQLNLTAVGTDGWN